MKYLSKGLLAILLCYTLVLQGCSLAWVGTLDRILAAAAPALNNVLTIVALASNKPVNQVLEDKITADAASLKKLATDFANASGTTPTTCQEVQAAAQILNDDAATVLSIVQSVGPAGGNLPAIFAAADAFVVVLVGLIPSCASPAALKSGIPAKVAKIDVGAMVRNYNAAVTKPSGNAAVDSWAKQCKLPEHGRFVHILTLGMVK
jgi:hypothetical protein